MGRKIDVQTQEPQHDLEQLGLHIRALRKASNLKVEELARAAGISRVTLYRIEHGEQSVTAGAYASVLSALGERLGVQDQVSSDAFPETIALSDFAQLKKLSWQLDPKTKLTPTEAWDIYARNWRHLDQTELTVEESHLIDLLRNAFEGARHV